MKFKRSCILIACLLTNWVVLFGHEQTNNIKLRQGELFSVTEPLVSLERGGQTIRVGEIIISMRFFYENDQLLFRLYLQTEFSGSDRRRLVMFEDGGHYNDVFTRIVQKGGQSMNNGRFLPTNLNSFYQTSPSVLKLRNKLPMGYLMFEERPFHDLVLDLNEDQIPEDNVFDFLLQFYLGQYSRRSTDIEITNRLRHFRYNIELVDFKPLSAKEKPIVEETVADTYVSVDCNQWYDSHNHSLDKIESDLNDANYSNRLTELRILLSQPSGIDFSEYENELNTIHSDLQRLQSELFRINRSMAEQSDQCYEQFSLLNQKYLLINNNIDNQIQYLTSIKELPGKGEPTLPSVPVQQPKARVAEEVKPVDDIDAKASEQLIDAKISEIKSIFNTVYETRRSSREIDSNLSKSLTQKWVRLEELKSEFDDIFNNLPAEMRNRLNMKERNFNEYYQLTLQNLTHMGIAKPDDAGIEKTDDVRVKSESSSDPLKILVIVLLILVVLLGGFIGFIRMRALRLKRKLSVAQKPSAIGQAKRTNRQVKSTINKSRKLKI